MASKGSVSVKGGGGGGTVSKGVIRTVFTDAIATRKGLTSPTPASKNK
jgi:hypothetical protein